MKPLNGQHGPQGTPIAESLLKTLDPEAVGALVSLGADVVMLIDKTAIISQVYCSNPELAEYGLAKTVGKRLQDCVTIESVPKIDSLLASDNTRDPVRGYQVNHKCGSKPDLPVVYSAYSSKDLPYSIVVGRELRQQFQDQQRLVQAQMELEADYRELQEAETRYRTAFKVAAAAYVMMDGEKRTVLDANASAMALLSPSGGPAVGKPLRDLFHKQDRDRLGDAIGEARHSPNAVHVDNLRSARGDSVSATIRSYRENGVTNLVLALWPATEEQETRRQRNEPVAATASVDLADLPEAAVQTDTDGIVMAANDLFLDLVHAPSLNQVIGRNFAIWFASSAIDIRVLYARLQDEQFIRGFSSTLTDNLSGERSVSLSARFSRETGTVHFILVPQAAPSERLTIPSPGAPDQAEGFSSLVGKVPLKDLMRESLDVIEKICIEAALDQTNNNRAYAAEILGLSRQSLYIKLRRYGLEDYRPGS
ncbi:transcriptional regulator PpsR [Rhizobium sp. Root274]|uniref:transcriptional regulator PpsR n=1 Tax=unclassified Rhizobium TaxID=2613769 RepID=UPI000712ECBF|nr:MULTISPECIES: transcriptional regulator PpsR [unclassified Rhizobium]KQW29636.1 transcriptional regulator PpsR [Rhizobium sp. Root1240]KRD29828.1 transcriptional regulator PpsR [Rhizobium sp. Root274]